MKKTIIILKSTPKSRAAFCEHVFHQTAPTLLAEGPETLKLSLSKDSPPVLSIVPFNKTPVACISVTGNGQYVDKVTQDPYFSSAHEVQEALPIAYDRDWPLGEATPGVCLLTLFKRKTGLDDPTFLDRWHNGHTPLTVKIHPIWNYVRNQVLETIQGPHFDGIVEEQVKQKSELLNPVIFFGGPSKFLWNMLVVYKDIRSFIEYSSIETYLTEEHWLKIT